MILDWYNTYDNDDDRPSLYLRMRGEDGILQERHIHPNDEDYQSPFCWVRQDADEWRIKQILKRYPGSSLHKDITAKGIDKKLLWKSKTKF